MPVPKRKTSKSRRDRRQSCKFIRPQQFSACTNCANPLAGHQACLGCGFYQGKKVLTTKAERMLKRMSERKAQEARAAATVQEPQNPS